MGQAKPDMAGYIYRRCKKWVSMTVVLMAKSGVLPVTVSDGHNSSPSVPAGTEEPKSK